RIRLALAVDLHLAGALDAVAHSRRRFARLGSFERARLEGRGGHVQVDAIEERSGDAHAIAADRVRRAMAASRVVPEIAARAWIHRGDELETRGKVRLPRGARDRDASGF